ncbi:hypothetical protein CEXT_136631 [Caerostris extrusa]|uniref:Uncharacterized protein n=1 Tax=Caerostris extrusa TaxID=172846 RepID=A0AAV4X7R6_CAEEX|nr:hypothetical protein CEXT_136631 [Caerostris extrusa]
MGRWYNELFEGCEKKISRLAPFHQPRFVLYGGGRLFSMQEIFKARFVKLWRTPKTVPINIKIACFGLGEFILVQWILYSRKKSFVFGVRISPLRINGKSSKFWHTACNNGGSLATAGGGERLLVANRHRFFCSFAGFLSLVAMKKRLGR